MDDCDKCEGWKPKLRKGSRCSECEIKFSEYREASWGLDEVINQRNKNQALGLCFLCGGSLGTDDRWTERICENCEQNSYNGAWSKQQHYKGGITSDTNPYSKVWDNLDDNAGYLVPSHGVMAQRARDKARYYQRLSERGGPKGRKAAEEAAVYNRIAESLKEEDERLRSLR